METDVVFAKVANIQNCLRRIRDVTALDPDRLVDLEEFVQVILRHFNL